MHRYAVCQRVLRSGDVATDIAWAAAGGASGIGLEAGSVLAAGLAAVTRALKAHDLSVSSLIGALDPVLTMRSDIETIGRVEDTVELSAQLGATGILLTTGSLGDRQIADADLACRRWFETMAPVAARAGVKLLLEPVHPLLRHVSYVHSLRHGAEITGELPGTGLLADTGHIWWDRWVTDDLVTFAGQIGSVQIDDIDSDALVDYSYRRTQLGDGVIPLAALISALESGGYAGFYENEIIARVPRADRIGFVRTGGRRLAPLLRSGY